MCEEESFLCLLESCTDTDLLKSSEDKCFLPNITF